MVAVEGGAVVVGQGLPPEERHHLAQPVDAGGGAGVELQRVGHQAPHVLGLPEAAPGGEGQLLQGHEQLPVQGHKAGEGQGLLHAVQHLLAEAGADNE